MNPAPAVAAPVELVAFLVATGFTFVFPAESSLLAVDPRKFLVSLPVRRSK